MGTEVKSLFERASLDTKIIERGPTSLQILNFTYHSTFWRRVRIYVHIYNGDTLCKRSHIYIHTHQYDPLARKWPLPQQPIFHTSITKKINHLQPSTCVTTLKWHTWLETRKKIKYIFGSYILLDNTEMMWCFTCVITGTKRIRED